MSDLSISLFQIILCTVVGILLAATYLFLLWYTVSSLKKVRHKGMLLVGSAIIRLALFLSVTIYVSQGNAACFLWIVFSFILTRFVIVNFVRSRGAK